MTKVEIYSTPACRYCQQAKRIFDQMSIPYVEYNVQQDSVSLHVLKESGAQTVPQIVIDGKWIGGYTEVAALKLSGELKKLLEG